MSGMRHELYFLTFHGGLICFDSKRQVLCHRRPVEIRPPVERLTVGYNGELAGLPGQSLDKWRFAPGLFEGTVSLTDAGLYASAALDGSLTIRVTASLQASCGERPWRISSTTRKLPQLRITSSPTPVEVAPPTSLST